MNLTDRAKIPDQVIARQVGGETVMLDLASGNYFSLDPVGARIWQLLQEGRSLAEILEVLTLEYDASGEEIERDLMRLVKEFAARGLISVQEGRAEGERNPGP